MEITRVSPEQARKIVFEGNGILACAYESEEKFQQNRLEGAISFQELNGRLSSLSKQQDIILYCA